MRLPPPIQIFEKSLIFDMCLWINKSYQWIILPEILKDLCLRYNQGKKLFFIFRDGENSELSGALNWISHIAQEANISSDRIIIQTYKQIHAPFATIEQLNPLDVFINNPYPTVDSTPINNFEFTKKMAALFGRFSIYRLRAARFIYNYVRDDALLTFKDSKLHILNQLNRFDLYTEESKWVEKVFPLPSVDGVTLSTYWPLDIRIISYGFKQIQPKFFVDVTIETDVYNPMFITEKTTRNFFFGKPFVVFAGPGYLHNIRQLGFKTFPELCDESYDTIENTEDRFQEYLKRIRTINAMSIEQLRQLAIEMQPTFEHNRNLMLERSRLEPNNLLWASSFDTMINDSMYPPPSDETV